MKIRATKIFKFEMAHQLETCKTESCKNVHGHGYCLEVTIERRPHEDILNKDGMILDFSVLKEIMKPIIEKYDHSFLTKENYGVNPTAENMLVVIRDQIYSSGLLAREKCVLVKLKLWETETGCVELIE